MRTKTLLLVAAVSAAGLASSMAQVYSVNVVGYVNQVMTNKNNLIANPLNAPTNTIQGVLSLAPNGSTAFRWTGVGYASAFKTGTVGLNNGAWTSPTTPFAPGGGLFLALQGTNNFNYTNTYVGEVLQGPLSTPFGATFSTLISSKVPQSGTPEALTLTTNISGTALIFKWNQFPGPGGYVSSFKTAVGTSFIPSRTISIAEAFFLQTTNVGSWNRNFTVGP